MSHINLFILYCYCKIKQVFKCLLTDFFKLKHETRLKEDEELFIILEKIKIIDDISTSRTERPNLFRANCFFQRFLRDPRMNISIYTTVSHEEEITAASRALIKRTHRSSQMLRRYELNVSQYDSVNSYTVVFGKLIELFLFYTSSHIAIRCYKV